MSDTEITEVTERRIEPSELLYFKKVTNGAARADELEAEAARLLQVATGLRGAHESWVSHLIEQYGLDPATDQINPETGAIEHSERAPNGHAGPG